MPFEFFLAQTAAQMGQPLPEDAKKAWMACHFSPYHTGLSNLPEQLPKGSMVIVDDSVPVADHDPQRIAAQLLEVVQAWQCSRILLDFQRPDDKRTARIGKAITQAVPCPVGISEQYAGELEGPVFLPPLPLHMPLEEYIAPWRSRPIWLELMPDRATYTITKDGCQKAACHGTGDLPHRDNGAFCRYRTEVTQEAVRFILCRDQEELALLRRSEAIDCFVGLYQDFAQPVAQDTALDQWASRSARSSPEISGANCRSTAQF